MRPLFILFVMFLMGCQGALIKSNHDNRNEAIITLLKDHLQPTGDGPVHSILVNLKDSGNAYHLAAGMADGVDLKVEKGFQFRAASITKMFTSTLVLQLAEEGEFLLTDPIYDYLKDDKLIRLDSLHMADNTNYSRTITIEQLLQHRSGLPDFYDDMSGFITYSESHPKSVWTASDLFAYYYDTDLNRKAHFRPGEGFHYSDVNYLLLTRLIEKVTGMDITVQYRQRILQPLKMKDTYLEYFEEPRGLNKMANAFHLEENIDKSGRWSGNGFISTTEDLTVFIEALIGGRLFKKDASLAAMKNMASETKKYKYGMGLMEISLLGKKFYGHSGFWGTHLLHCPESNQTICISVNQAVVPFNRIELIEEVLMNLK